MKTCKLCGKDTDRKGDVCNECYIKNYGKTELIANPNFTLEDYKEALPLHPVDKFGWKKEIS